MTLVHPIVPWDCRKSIAFKKIDRKNEDKEIVLFQKTQDDALLEKIYHRRISTIQIWSRKYCYMMDGSFDDMYGEFCYAFVRAVDGYNRRRGNFNNFLYNCFLNVIRNEGNNKKAKKRKPIGNRKNFLLSLEYEYTGKDGARTLKDIISNQIVERDRSTDSLKLKEMINVLANENNDMRYFLINISRGSTVAAVLRDIKTRSGKIRVAISVLKKIVKRNISKKKIKALIHNYIQDDFKLLDYNVKNNKLSYIVEMRKTKETDYILKELRRMKINETAIMDKLSA